MKVISNTTVISNFSEIHRVDLLESLFSEIYITSSVYEEIITGIETGYDFYKTLLAKINTRSESGFIHLIELSNDELLKLIELPSSLHKGESSSIIIAQNREYLFLTDDRLARNYFKQNQISFSGTIGCLILSVRKKILDLQTANEILAKMIQNGFYSPAPKLDDFINL